MDMTCVLFLLLYCDLFIYAIWCCVMCCIVRQEHFAGVSMDRCYVIFCWYISRDNVGVGMVDMIMIREDIGERKKGTTGQGIRCGASWAWACACACDMKNAKLSTYIHLDTIFLFTLHHHYKAGRR